MMKILLGEYFLKWFLILHSTCIIGREKTSTIKGLNQAVEKSSE